MLDKLFSKYPLKKYKKGEIVLKLGNKPQFVGLVKIGHIKVFGMDKSGQEIVMPFFEPIFNFTAILAMTNKINPFNFQAISATEMWVMPKEKFIKIMESKPEVAKMVLENVSNLFLNFAQINGKLLSSSSLARVALMIIIITDNKVNFPITHKMIAGLTGLTRETVTLQMLKLEKMKLVDNKGRKVTIFNRDGLEKIVGK